MKTTYFKLILFFILLFLFQISNAQQDIELTNPSFEDFPYPGHAPRGWYDCGNMEFPNETPPDVHPVEDSNSSFGVDLPAIDGNTYLGLVVRENDSWESVSQKLKSPLQKGKCYTFSIHLSRSKTYVSSIRGTDRKVSFTEPLKLRVWGGNGYCDKKQLLFESDAVGNIMWEKFNFYFTPEEEFSSIKLEAFFKTPALSAPNGNLLLDKASSFQLISCDDVKMKLKMVREKIDMEELKKNRQKIDEISRTRKKLKPLARKVKFKKDILTPKGESNLQKIVFEMEDISEFKLIIDFNGLKDEKAKLRTQSILEVFKEADFSAEDYEIRNSKEEDRRGIWFVDKNAFYLGVMEKSVGQ